METDEKLLSILVVSEKYNPDYVMEREDYKLIFSNKEQAPGKVSENRFGIVIIDGTAPEELEALLGKLAAEKEINIFVCGEIHDKEKLYKVNRNIFFWDSKFENISLDKAIQLTRLKDRKNKYEAENRSLKDKLEMQKIMLAELEQTNNNLISATWRERDMKQQLKEAMEQIERSKSIIEQQNKRISESINYARKIQLAINPTENDLRVHLPQSFILYIPKDTISGDFPWFTHKKECLYVAAVDCTGHGVPGAMMSMIGNLLLNDIVNNTEYPAPGAILDDLHQAVVNTLKQRISTSNSTDGMDIAMIRIDEERSQVVFASAHRPLFLIRDSELTEYKGDKFPIGGIQYDKKRTAFGNTIIPYKKGDIMLIFSDGLPDQIGGEEKKKFMSGRVAEIAKANSDKTMEELKALYHTSIHEWMSTAKQVDDILLIGIRF